MVTTYSTGTTILADVGECSYNGATFSPNFHTRLSGTAVSDDANRVVKYVRYLLEVDGYVVLQDGSTSIDTSMRALYDLLTTQGAKLIYTGRGYDITVDNSSAVAGGRVATKRDVAFGPVPKLIEFQPMGAARSAKVKWQCEFHLFPHAVGKLGLLQLNYETSLKYGEDGYAGFSIAGTMEIPLTAKASAIGGALGVRPRSIDTTVDDFRATLETRILSGIDLSRFRVVDREFAVSRDKRTMHFTFRVEEKPYMDLPPYCTIARGNYNVRPTKMSMGLVNWLCTLRVTYNLPRSAFSPAPAFLGGGFIDVPRRMAWFMFLDLLKLRMSESVHGGIPGGRLPRARTTPLAGGFKVLFSSLPTVIGMAKSTFGDSALSSAIDRKAFLINLTIDEGLYLDSKTITFSATWRLITRFEDILKASGVWTKLPETDTTGKNLWATTVAPIMGVYSWLPEVLDPALDVVVDFGSDRA